MSDLPMLRGLDTSSNPIARAPGALVKAENVFMRDAGVVVPRNGVNYFSGSILGRGEVLKWWAAQGVLVVGHAYDASNKGLSSVDTSGVVTSMDTGLPVWTWRPSLVEWGQNLYLGSNVGDINGGVYRFEGASSSQATAGVPRMPDAHPNSGGTTGSSGFMPTDSQVSYRAVLGLRDGNDNVILGAPSGRLRRTNSTGGTRDVTNRWILPRRASAAHFIQVYRTRSTSSASVVPSDEHYLVHERQLTSSDITNQYVDITDRTPDALLRAPLYTNPNSGEGPLAENDELPQAVNGLAWWDGRMWYLGPTWMAEEVVQLIGVGSPDGLQADDTIQVGGVIYTAKASPSTNKQFLLYTSGTASQNIERTSQELVRCINQDPDATAAAYYLSPTDDSEPAGKILLRSLLSAADGFSAVVSRESAWVLGGGVANDIYERDYSAACWSKLEEAESLPRLNRLPVGLGSDVILCAVPLRDRLYVFLRDGGIAAITGSEPYYRVEMVDDSAVLRARDTAVVHAGRVFALTSKGVVAISEAGVEIVSEAIRKDLEPYVKNMFLGPAFAVSVEADHRIEFWLPSESSADIGQCVAAYVYNSKHGEWFVSTDDNGFRHGVGATPAVSELLNKSSSRALYAEHATSNRVVQERLPGDSSAEELDHLAGRASSYTATAVSSATVTVASTTGIEVGDGIIQTVSGDARRCIVTAVLSSTQFTVDVSGYVAVASFVAVKPVDVSLRISEIDNRAPNQRKRIRDAVLHFRDAVVRQFGYLTMKNDVGNVEKHEIFRTPNWGSEEWGASPFGDPEPFRRRVRKGVPLAASDGVSIRIGLDVSEAFAWFELIGASLEGEPVSERTGR